MTILSCQKRKHEPHTLRDPLEGGFYCDGEPQWPYARPKPPRIAGFQYMEYREKHGITAVWKVEENEWVTETNAPQHHSSPTHAEAIVYAQNLVNERK